MPTYPEKRTKLEGHDHEVCPNCGMEMCGGQLIEWGKEYTKPGTTLGDKGMTPEEYAEAYGWPKKLCGSQIIGIETGSYDGVSVWRYPCCGLEIDRFTREKIRLQKEIV